MRFLCAIHVRSKITRDQSNANARRREETLAIDGILRCSRAKPVKCARTTEVPSGVCLNEGQPEQICGERQRE